MKKMWVIITLAVFMLSLVLVGCTDATRTQGTQIQGPQGEQGVQGIQGLQGEQGIQGLKGDTGKDGDKGKTGDKGDRGLRGYEGDEGEEGDRGLRGLTGIQGEQGLQGEPGVDGLNGIDGEDGKDGENGQSAPILLLMEKDDSWDIVNGEYGGFLTYSESGDEFTYFLTARCKQYDEDYSLIYYVDPWPGTGGFEIATGSTDNEGMITLVGEVELASDIIDGKVWLVLSDDYDDSAGEMTGWHLTEYLFEHNLITYESD